MSVTCGTMSSSLTEREIMLGNIFPVFQIKFYKYENYKPTCIRSSTNNKQHKQKTIPSHITIKLLKTNDKEEILKAARAWPACLSG